MHHCNQTPSVNWTIINETKLLRSRFFLFRNSQSLFNLETDEILIISAQVIDLQDECITKHRQDRRHHGHHGDGNHNGFTQNSDQGAENVGRNESKGKRDTSVVREEVKLEGKGGKNSTISV